MIMSSNLLNTAEAAFTRLRSLIRVHVLCLACVVCRKGLAGQLCQK